MRSPLTGLMTLRPSGTPVLVRSLSAALLGALAERVVDVVAHLLLVLGARGQLHHVGVLGRHHEERRAEQRVRPRGEDRVVDADLGAGERDLGALGAADPVALHRLDVRRPLDAVEIVQQAVGVVGDAEEPLLQLAQLDDRAAALAAAVDDLLVGQHGGVLRAPVDRGVLAVGQAALEELEEQPLRPPVVARLAGGELARPVDRDPPGAERPLELLDRLLRRHARVHAGLDRVVLGGQAERVVAHRVQHALAAPAVEVRDGIADRVVLQVPHVRLAARVGQHLEDVGGVLARDVVGDLPRLLAIPDRLPLGLDGGRVVTALVRHGSAEVSDEGARPRGRPGPSGGRPAPDRAGGKRSAQAATLRRAVPPWGYSSAGRASGWQPEGRRFEPG